MCESIFQTICCYRTLKSSMSIPYFCQGCSVYIIHIIFIRIQNLLIHLHLFFLTASSRVTQDMSMGDYTHVECEKTETSGTLPKPIAGLDPRTHEIMTRAKTKSWNSNWVCHPGAPTFSKSEANVIICYGILEASALKLLARLNCLVPLSFSGKGNNKSWLLKAELCSPEGHMLKS